MVTAFVRPDNHGLKAHRGSVSGSGRGDLHLRGIQQCINGPLAKHVRGLNHDKQWNLVFMNRENPLLHPNRSMCATPLTDLRACSAVIVPPPAALVMLGTPLRLQKVRRLVGLSALKCHLGTLAAQREDHYAPLDSIKKAPIWERVEWSSFHSLLARPVREPEMDTTDEAVHTIAVKKTDFSCSGTVEGPQVMVVQSVKQAVPGAFVAFKQCAL